MAQVKVFYEPKMELLTIFWHSPRPNQLCTKLGNGIILIENADSGEPIGMELLAYKPGDARFDSVSVEIGTAPSAA